MWQDAVFTLGLSVFVGALLPTLWGKEKPPLLTSIPTATMQIVLAITFATLGLWFAAVTGFILGVEWWWLVIQRARR